jgi:hypothetical protein
VRTVALEEGVTRMRLFEAGVIVIVMTSFTRSGTEVSRSEIVPLTPFVSILQCQEDTSATEQWINSSGRNPFQRVKLECKVAKRP